MSKLSLSMVFLVTSSLLNLENSNIMVLDFQALGTNTQEGEKWIEKKN